MPDFTLENEWFFPSADPKKVVYYSAYAIATNFNLAAPILAPPPQLGATVNKHKRLILEGISLYIAGSAAGVTAYPVIMPAVGPIQYCTCERKMSEYATDTLMWNDLHIPCDLSSLQRSLSIITMELAEYAATDDLTLYIWGYLE